MWMIFYRNKQQTNSFQIVYPLLQLTDHRLLLQNYLRTVEFFWCGNNHYPAWGTNVIKVYQGYRGFLVYNSVWEDLSQVTSTWMAGSRDSQPWQNDQCYVFQLSVVLVSWLIRGVSMQDFMWSGNQQKTPYRLVGIFSARPKSPTTAV